MLKRFFISVLGTVAGIWIAIFLAIFGGILLVGVAVGQSSADSAIKVEKRSILYFDLSGDIKERYQAQPFFEMIQTIDNHTTTLDEMLRSLYAAADDDKIDGLYIDCGGAAMGTASREELLEAIAYFKESGKWVAAYADVYSQGDYMIASTADSLYLNPMGAVDIHGVGGKTPFFKGLLDKLGVKMQIIKVGTFKSAVEPYILTAMSEPARLQMQQYCDSIWTFVVDNIAQNRGIAPDSIRAWAPLMISTRCGETFVADGLVDALRYRRLVDDRLRELTDIDRDKDIRFVSPGDYLSARDLTHSSAKNHIAVYYAVGDIVDSGSEGIVGPTVTDDIIKLADDDKVRGLVLRVNSPGGSAFASEQIWEALQYFKSKKKPLYVSMGDYAASGGYYISCGADTIFADRTTLTGSIGVFGMIPDLSGLVTDKFGVNFSTVETNPNAAGISLLEPMTPSQHAAMQRSVDNIYELFTSRVAAGRDMSVDSVKAIAEGRVWVGSKAVELGLVDYLGSLDCTIAAMAENLGMDTDEVVRYPKTEEKFWERIIRESGNLDAVKAGIGADLDPETLRTLHFIKRLREMNPMQARMEEVTIE
ncbi:MAG: signal peptide peptidase SppA [Muribaculaceae bacterium]|nr:signal peptide peptidase SppA [Muribaculaceae bacterium]